MNAMSEASWRRYLIALCLLVAACATVWVLRPREKGSGEAPAASSASGNARDHRTTTDLTRSAAADVRTGMAAAGVSSKAQVPAARPGKPAGDPVFGLIETPDGLQASRVRPRRPVELSRHYVLVGEAKAHPNRLLARFSTAATLGKAIAALSESRFEPFRMPLNRAGVLVLESTAREETEGATSEEAQRKGVALSQRINVLQASGQFEYVEPDYVVTTQAVPSDGAFSGDLLWGLRNTGQSGGAAGEDIDTVRAWDITTGSTDVAVAVIDTGIRYTHQDLEGQMWRNAGEIPGNGIDDDSNGYADDIFGINVINGSGNPMDDHNHGTHCAGTIGAKANGGGDHVGVAWQVSLMALKFLGADGSGATSDAVECIEYAVSQNVRILSNSWGGGGASIALENAIRDAGSSGALFVAAAGNARSNNDVSPSYPASYRLDNIQAVAAIGRSGSLASFSNYGAATVHLAAPGVDIYSSTATSDSSYAFFSGTSMATPHVAGVAALVAARYPGIDLLSLKNRVLQGAVPTSALAGKLITGGRVSAYNALTLGADGHFEVVVAAADHPVVAGNETVFEAYVSDVDKVTGASVTASNSARGINASFLDDGRTPDRIAGDGIYTATITLPATDGNGASTSIDLVFSVFKSGMTPYLQTKTFQYVDPLTNDHFANARMITGTSYTSPAVRNTYATIETGEPKHEAGGGGKSVWWGWTAPRSGRVQMDTVSSSFDTSLAVYTGSALSSLALVASNDDIDLATGTYTSSLAFDAVAGTTYRITVDGVYYYSAGRTSSGTVRLNLLLNTQPVASSLDYTITEGMPANLSLAATDADGQELRFVITSPPSHGRAGNPNALDGVFPYTPKPGFRGQDSLLFTATDGIETSAPAQVRITVLASADVDGDGLPNVWETAHALNPAVNDAALDPDGDGLTNLQEYLGERDPQDRASGAPTIAIAQEAAGAFAGTSDWGVGIGGNSLRNGLSRQQGPTTGQLAWAAGADSLAGFNIVVEGDVVVATRATGYTSEPADRQQNSVIVAHSLQSGTLLWEKRLPVDFPNTDGFNNVLGICNGVVYATRGTDYGKSYLYALSAANGQTLWRSSEAFINIGYGLSAIFAPNGDPLLADISWGTFRVSAQNGTIVWRQTARAFAGIAIFGDRIYGLGYVFIDPTKPATSKRARGLAVCDLATGTFLNQQLILEPRWAVTAQEACVFVGPDGTIYVPRSEGNEKADILWAVADSGSDFRVKWALPLALRRNRASFGIGPDGSIYSHSRDNRIIRIDPDYGQVLHSSQALSSDRNFGTTELQLAVDAAGLVFASNEDTLYSFNADLTQRWSTPVAGVNIGGPRLGANGTLVVHGAGTNGIKAYRTAATPLPTPPTQPATMSITFSGNILEEADTPGGPWTVVPGATSPWSVTPVQSRRFYRSRLY